MPLLLRQLVNASVVVDSAFDAAAAAAASWHSVPLHRGRLARIEQHCCGRVRLFCFLRHSVPPPSLLTQPVRCCGRLFLGLLLCGWYVLRLGVLALGAAAASAAAAGALLRLLPMLSELGSRLIV